MFKKVFIFLILPVLQHLGVSGKETVSVGNFGMLAFADHLHAHKPLNTLQERETPKSIIGPL